jgi:NitT/TauT family transport system permease protein
MAIPTDLKEASEVFRFARREKWRRLILPGIFPYLVTGLVTAAGGAWNASIVAEYFHLKGQTISTTGLGATISHATDAVIQAGGMNTSRGGSPEKEPQGADA